MNEKFLALGLEENWAAGVEKAGFLQPTAIQSAAIPKILAGQNMVGQSPTGTGKTLAYLLPMLQKISADIPGVQAIVLAPTYELVMQIFHQAQQLLNDAGSSIRVQSLVGSGNISRQLEKLKKKPQVVIGSAGRVLELIERGKVKVPSVRVMVLDEFDRLLDKQNQDVTAAVMERIPKEVQFLLFSATAPKHALEQADFLSQMEHIRIEEAGNLPQHMENLYVQVSFRDKIKTLRTLTRTLPVKRGLVFINRVYDAEQTLAKLRYDGLNVESLLGSANKQARKNALAAFKTGKANLLLSTDLAARGLDIPDIDYVFNLDFPEDHNVYLHRAGRTARAGAFGRVVTLLDAREAVKFAALEKKLGVSFQPLRKKPVKKAPGKREKKRK